MKRLKTPIYNSKDLKALPLGECLECGRSFHDDYAALFN